MAKKAKHLPKKKETAAAEQKPKKPQGILDYSSVLESEVDLTEFQKAWQEHMEKDRANGSLPPRGGVILPSYRHRDRRLIKTA